MRLVAEAAEALLAGRLPDPAARLFLGGALAAWLRDGGRLGALERDFLRVAAPRRSTMTPSRVWASTCRATADDEGGTVVASTTGASEHDPDD